MQLVKLYGTSDATGLDSVLSQYQGTETVLHTLRWMKRSAEMLQSGMQKNKF